MKTFAELGFPGRLIAVEGLDGSGKSTQIYLLKRWLELQGLKVFFSEWNSSTLVKNATSKGKKRELLSPTTFSLIHATDFADRYERQLVPLLRAGYIVLCDRYIFTAFARDTVRGCPPEWVRGIYNFAAMPDLVFFFKAPLEISLQRILDGRPQLKYFEAGMDLRLSSDPYESFRIFQGRILEQYLAMSADFKFLVIDANQPIEAQQNIVRDLVAAKLDLDQVRARTDPTPKIMKSRRAAHPLERTIRRIVVPKGKPRRFYGQGVPGVDLSKLAGKLIVVEGRRRLGALHPDRPPGAMAGRQRPRHRAGRPQTLHPGQRGTGPGAAGQHPEPHHPEPFLRDRFRRPIGEHHFARLAGRIHGPGRPLHLHPDGARHGAGHGPGLAAKTSTASPWCRTWCFISTCSRRN